MTAPLVFDHPSILKITRGEKAKDNRYLIRCDNCGHEYEAGHSTAIRIQLARKRGCNKCAERKGGARAHSTYPDIEKAASEMAFIDTHWRVTPSYMFFD